MLHAPSDAGTAHLVPPTMALLHGRPCFVKNRKPKATMAAQASTLNSPRRGEAVTSCFTPESLPARNQKATITRTRTTIEMMRMRRFIGGSNNERRVALNARQCYLGLHNVREERGKCKGIERRWTTLRLSGRNKMGRRSPDRCAFPFQSYYIPYTPTPGITSVACVTAPGNLISRLCYLSDLLLMIIPCEIDTRFSTKRITQNAFLRANES